MLHKRAAQVWLKNDSGSAQEEDNHSNDEEGSEKAAADIHVTSPLVGLCRI